MDDKYFQVSVTCPVCGGSGWVWVQTQTSEKCTNCNGTGTIVAQMRIDKGKTSDYMKEA